MGEFLVSCRFLGGNAMEPIILTNSEVLSLLPERDAWSHKGNFGRVLLLCGSRGYTGAAALAAKAAMRAGAGLVYLGVPESIYAIEAVKLDEPVVFPLPEKDGRLSVEALPEILERGAGCDAVLIGCGSGRSDDLRAIAAALLRQEKRPMILDADGINALQGHTDLLCGKRCPVILTPHDGEFLRLGFPLGADRQASAVAAAKALCAVVLLKGHRTVITDGEKTYVNHTGNPGMATGGSGDVLAGILVSLLGQGLPPLEAAACAAWLHGAAGDRAAARLGQYGMTPTDLLLELPHLLK